MDSDDEIGIDSGNVSSDEDYDFMQVDEIQRSRDNPQDNPDYPFEVLTTEEIVKHMLECISEVTNVVEVSSLRIEKRNFIIQSDEEKFVVVTSITFACASVSSTFSSIQMHSSSFDLKGSSKT